MRAFFLFLAASCLWAQVDGITTSVSRTVTLAPDEARFDVDVFAPFGTGLDPVLERLSGAGILSTDLAEQLVSQPNSSSAATSSAFNFRLTRPIVETKPELDRLEAVQRALPTGFVMRFTVTFAPSTRAVAELRSSVEPQLLSEARRKALTIADATGLTLGVVESVLSVRPRQNVYVALGVYRGGTSPTFSGGLGGVLIQAPIGPLLPVKVVQRNEAGDGVLDAESVSGFQATYAVTVRFAAR